MKHVDDITFDIGLHDFQGSSSKKRKENAEWLVEAGQVTASTTGRNSGRCIPADRSAIHDLLPSHQFQLG